LLLVDAMLAFDGCDVKAITFLFYETKNESTIKMIIVVG
jgi:hypothetical protein